MDNNDEQLRMPGADALQPTVRLLLVIRRRLHREGYAALIAGDPRFRQTSLNALHETTATHNNTASSNSISGSPVVALVDVSCDDRALRDLFADRPIAGGVLLADLPHGGQVGPVPIGKVALSVRGIDASWEEVAKTLALAARGVVEPESRKAGAPESDMSEADSIDGARGRPLSEDLDLYLKLTPREQQVLRALGLGKPPPQIASELHIALSTVENHKSRLMKKADIHRMAELVRFAVRVGAAPL